MTKFLIIDKISFDFELLMREDPVKINLLKYSGIFMNKLRRYQITSDIVKTVSAILAAIGVVVCVIAGVKGLMKLFIVSFIVAGLFAWIAAIAIVFDFIREHFQK